MAASSASFSGQSPTGPFFTPFSSPASSPPMPISGRLSADTLPEAEHASYPHLTPFPPSPHVTRLVYSKIPMLKEPADNQKMESYSFLLSVSTLAEKGIKIQFVNNTMVLHPPTSGQGAWRTLLNVGATFGIATGASREDIECFPERIYKAAITIYSIYPELTRPAFEINLNGLRTLTDTYRDDIHTLCILNRCTSMIEAVLEQFNTRVRPTPELMHQLFQEKGLISKEEMMPPALTEKIKNFIRSIWTEKRLAKMNKKITRLWEYVKNLEQCRFIEDHKCLSVKIESKIAVIQGYVNRTVPLYRYLIDLENEGRQHPKSAI